jgi:hypothetical protein
MANINGSAKQITWAQSIIETALKALPFAAKEATERLTKMATQHPAEMVEQLVVTYVAKLETKLNSLDSARYIIDNRRALTAGSDYLYVEIVKILTSGKAGDILTVLYCTADEVLEVRAAVKAAYEAKQAEIAAAEAEVEAAETVEAAEVAAQEDAIDYDIFTGNALDQDGATTTLETYRHAVRCTVCRKRTSIKAATGSWHYNDCPTKEEDWRLIFRLQRKQAVASAKRKATRLAKAEAALEAAHQAVEQMTRKIGGSMLGIHKVYGSTGIHTVRSAEGTCTCPGHKRHGHCKHVHQVREVVEQIAHTRQEIARLSNWIIAQVQ